MLLVSAVAATPLAAQPATGRTVTTADGRGADNQVMGFGNGRELLSKGKAAQVELRAHAFSGNNYYGVLRFDVAPLGPVQETQAARLVVTLVDAPTARGDVVVYGLKDAYAGGPDERGKPERGEADYAEGDLNWKEPTDDAVLTGDNAPGLAEDRAGVEGFDRPGSPFSRLGVLRIPADAQPDAKLALATPEVARFLARDTNGVAVIYLVSAGAHARIAAKESGKPATLSVE